MSTIATNRDNALIKLKTLIDEYTKEDNLDPRTDFIMMDKIIPTYIRLCNESLETDTKVGLFSNSTSNTTPLLSDKAYNKLISELDSDDVIIEGEVIN